MKNKKMVFGIVIFLFAITGICSISNVFAESYKGIRYIPASSYMYFYMGYLEEGDKILINEIDSDGVIDVLIMNSEQLDEFYGYSFSCEYSWQDIVYLYEWSFYVYEIEDYYIVLWNTALLTERSVYIDLSVDYYYQPYEPSIPAWLIPLSIILSIIIFGTIIFVLLILVRRHKRKTPKEVITIQEKETPKIIYCQECGAEILGNERIFCSKCGSKIK